MIDTPSFDPNFLLAVLAGMYLRDAMKGYPDGDSKNSIVESKSGLTYCQTVRIIIIILTNERSSR